MWHTGHAGLALPVTDSCHRLLSIMSVRLPGWSEAAEPVSAEPSSWQILAVGFEDDGLVRQQFVETMWCVSTDNPSVQGPGL